MKNKRGELPLWFWITMTVVVSALWGGIGGVTIYNNMINDGGQVVGAYFSNETLEYVGDTINTTRYEGDWIIIDVEWMTYEQAVETCDHEVAHHIFSRRDCYDYPKDCFGVDDTEVYAEFCEHNIEICIENTNFTADV